MSTSISTLDRKIARSLLNTISNIPMPTKLANQSLIVPSQLTDEKEDLSNENPSASRLHRQLGLPTNTNIIPMYYDVIIDTVSDYDIFYPVARQTETYYRNPPFEENSFRSCRHVDRVDEVAVSIDFPHDHDSIFEYKNSSPINDARFNEHLTKTSPPRNNTETSSFPLDQYYFYPELFSKINNPPSPVQFITIPFFYFPPVFNPNYAICIPTARSSVHAYLTPPSSYDPIQL